MTKYEQLKDAIWLTFDKLRRFLTYHFDTKVLGKQYILDDEDNENRTQKMNWANYEHTKDKTIEEKEKIEANNKKAIEWLDQIAEDKEEEDKKNKNS